MQEWMRGCYDSYIEESKPDQVLDLVVLRIPKGGSFEVYGVKLVNIYSGTSIPSSLVLFREYSARFSIQPSYPRPLRSLNDTLSDFYSRYAVATKAEEWMVNNEYHMAIADDATESWMSQ
ncbi:MAG: hypothetical protein Q9187_008175 [Circinaria calcarea]